MPMRGHDRVRCMPRRQRRRPDSPPPRRALGALLLLLLAAGGGGCRRAVLHALRAPSPESPEERIEAATAAPAPLEAVVRRVATGEDWLACTVTLVGDLDALRGRCAEFGTNVSMPFEGEIHRSSAEPGALAFSGTLPADMRPPEIRRRRRRNSAVSGRRSTRSPSGSGSWRDSAGSKSGRSRRSPRGSRQCTAWASGRSASSSISRVR